MGQAKKKVCSASKFFLLVLDLSLHKHASEHEPSAVGGSVAGQEQTGLGKAKDGRWGTEALFSCTGKKQRRGLYPGKHRARHASAPEAVPSASLTAAASSA